MATVAGFVAEDRFTHVQTHAPAGTPVALCGIGVITRRLPGDFHPGDKLNCSACEDLLDD